MSKYTTEVRFICETKSGLSESTGCDDVDKVLANSWNKIFTSNVSFFDENYRSVLCQKILKHYYLREICCETVGIWKLWMNTRLEEIMPYYNQLYKSALIDFNPMHDVDLTRTHKLNVAGTKEENGTRGINSKNNTNTTNTINKDSNYTDNGTKKDLYSDTPQGAITGIENENYLTNARKITDENSGNNNEKTNATEKTDTEYNENETNNNNGKTNTTEDYVETISGKQGGSNFSSMLNEFRKTMLNIDMQVIDEFSDLFFGLW